MIPGEIYRSKRETNNPFEKPPLIVRILDISCDYIKYQIGDGDAWNSLPLKTFVEVYEPIGESGLPKSNPKERKLRPV